MASVVAEVADFVKDDTFEKQMYEMLKKIRPEWKTQNIKLEVSLTYRFFHRQ